jgi:hypothetical protein
LTASSVAGLPPATADAMAEPKAPANSSADVVRTARVALVGRSNGSGREIESLVY